MRTGSGSTPTPPRCCICAALARVACSTVTPRALRTSGACLARRRTSDRVSRQEFLNDADAPEPNSLVVATSAVVADRHGRVLLQPRADSGNLALPGGGVGMGESLVGSVVRQGKDE